MKKTVLISLMFLLLGNLGYSQPERSLEKVEERVEAMRIAFITDKLRLTPQESQEFWPVYNQFQDELEQLRRNFRSSHGKLHDLSEQEAEAFLNDHLNMEQKELDLKRSYFQRLKGILPVRKIALLGVVEKEFKAKLLEQIKERRANRNSRFRN